MILICPPRSGSEWFLDGLVNHKYPRWEILCDSNRFIGTSTQLFQNISTPARLQMLRVHSAGTAHKVLSTDLLRLKKDDPHFDQVMNHLSTRKDLYWLERRNQRRNLISFLVAVYNLNFHLSYPPAKPFVVQRAEFDRIHDMMCIRSFDIVKPLQFVERLVYEDLLAGDKPRTIEFDRTKSTIKERVSINFKHLFNYDEVLQWMNEMNVPGDLGVHST